MPKPRHITRWIMTDPRRHNEENTQRLATALSAYPELRATAEHVREFADLMNKHRGEDPPTGSHACKPIRYRHYTP